MFELYKSIKKFVFNLYTGKLDGYRAGRAKKLVQMIYSIIRSKSCNLSKIASKIKGLQKFASKIKGVKCWLMHPKNTYDEHYEVFAKALLEAISRQGELIFAIDGSVMGEGCICLMVSVLFNGRALPICWISRVGKKGHFPEQMHVDLLEQLSALIADNTQVTILGDGEFDGCDIQALCELNDWKYVLRTAKDILLENQQGEQFQLKDMDLAGQFCLFFTDLYFTAKRYGLVNVGFYHHEKYEDPIFLVTNMDEAQD
ncbi:MAG: hypothetical protein AAFO82_16620, partial [Bacteroidota bacterium]